jgi:hypothetical protein
LREHLGLGRRIVLLELLLPRWLVKLLLVDVLLLGWHVVLILVLVLRFGRSDAARNRLGLKMGQWRASARHRKPTFRVMGL